MDDLLARTRCFKFGELGHLARDCPRKKERATSSEKIFSGMVCNDACAGDSRNESRADGDSRHELCVNDEFQRDNETFLDVRKDDETFPVPGSSSRFSIGSVVGPLQEQHVDSKLESKNEAEHNMSESRVNSPETKHPRFDFLGISHRSVVVSLRALELLSTQFLSFVFDVTSVARRVRRLSRDRRCENNHRHHIDSWDLPKRRLLEKVLAALESLCSKIGPPISRMPTSAAKVFTPNTFTTPSTTEKYSASELRAIGT